MARVYYQQDVDGSHLRGKTIAVLGYGSQGHAHALNLRDSGHRVLVGLRERGSSWERARADGMDVRTFAEAVREADVVMFLVPDHVQPQVWREEVRPNLKKGAALGFAHGFSIHFNQIVPPPDVDVFMVAPKGPGSLVRRCFLEGSAVPSLVAVYQDASGSALKLALAYADGIGCSRAGMIETTFKEETETDLFGEQAVLCGGVTELVKAGFETLVEAGYQPEIAYFECLNELKLIVDLMYEGGIAHMRRCVSDTAKYGDMIAGPFVIDSSVRARMRELLRRVQDGSFAKDWILENQTGRPRMSRWMEAESNHLIERVGAELRSRMDWLKR